MVIHPRAKSHKSRLLAHLYDLEVHEPDQGVQQELKVHLLTKSKIAIRPMIYLMQVFYSKVHLQKLSIVSGGELLNKKLASSISLGVLLFSILSISAPLALAVPPDQAHGPPDHIDEPEAVIYVTSPGDVLPYYCSVCWRYFAL